MFNNTITKNEKAIAGLARDTDSALDIITATIERINANTADIDNMRNGIASDIDTLTKQADTLAGMSRRNAKLANKFAAFLNVDED